MAFSLPGRPCGDAQLHGSHQRLLVRVRGGPVVVAWGIESVKTASRSRFHMLFLIVSGELPRSDRRTGVVVPTDCVSGSVRQPSHYPVSGPEYWLRVPLGLKNSDARGGRRVLRGLHSETSASGPTRRSTFPWTAVRDSRIQRSLLLITEQSKT